MGLDGHRFLHHLLQIGRYGIKHCIIYFAQNKFQYQIVNQDHGSLCQIIGCGLFMLTSNNYTTKIKQENGYNMILSQAGPRILDTKKMEDFFQQILHYHCYCLQQSHLPSTGSLLKGYQMSLNQHINLTLYLQYPNGSLTQPTHLEIHPNQHRVVKIGQVLQLAMEVINLNLGSVPQLAFLLIETPLMQWR